MAAPKKIAHWEILGPLGTGGNAEVWLTTDGQQEVALKVLKTKKVESEPYGRFRNEIDVLRRFKNEKGVLPILEASLPDRPSKDSPAWIAMPRAKLIREALRGKPLTNVVAAVAEMSATLARVAAAGIAHRDLKPENLYRYKRRWVVSDFGLAHLPEPSEKRFTDRRLGPFGYMPDELFDNAADADPFPVDVFQLAKCLLVLGSGANDPPQGHVPADSSGALSRYVAEPRSAELDQLIDRSTRREPTSRPTMAQFAQELETWLTYTPPEGEIDASELVAQFRQAHTSTFQTRDQRDDWLRRLEEIRQQVESSTMAWAYTRLTEAGLRPEMAGYHEHNAWVERGRYMGSQPGLASVELWVTAEFGEIYFPTKIAIGVGLDVDVQGEFWCSGHVAWGDMESTATRHAEIEERTAQIESLSVGPMLEALNRDIQAACITMLKELASRPNAG